MRNRRQYVVYTWHFSLPGKEVDLISGFYFFEHKPVENP